MYTKGFSPLPEAPCVGFGKGGRGVPRLRPVSMYIIGMWIANHEPCSDDEQTLALLYETELT